MSSSWDSTVRVWSHSTSTSSSKKSTLELVGELEHDTEVTSCDINVAGDGTVLVVSATKDGLITIWDVESLSALSQFSNHDGEVTKVRISNQSNHKASP